MTLCLVALGSNLGDRAALIHGALSRLGSEPSTSALTASPLHETQPIGGAPGQQPFLNAVATFETSLSPQSLLALLQRIEHDLGRQRSERWSARTIDLDLVLFGDEVIDMPELVVPHPRMAFRRFVVEPAAQIAPQRMHPTIGWTMAQLLDHLNTAVPYLALVGMPSSGKTHLATSVANTVRGRFLADPSSQIPSLTATNDSGPTLAADIELLSARAKVLARANWPNPGVSTISDFYFDQGLAYAETRLPAGDVAAFRREYDALASQVVLPKLLVVLDTRPSTLSGQCSTNDAPAEEALRRRMLALAARRGIGPVLYVGRGDPNWQLQEIVAAVQAMEPPPTKP
jgi:2-amino-4-hydroxy-6-hydroxymethyldihydropteridine diphosphokinase